MSYTPLTIKGRGSAADPPNRFEKVAFVVDDDAHVDPAERPAPGTVLLRDNTRTIIASNDSPDVGFERSINVYRGCEHGCVYCFARPGHEYLGFSAGLDFETKIVVKFDAPALLRKELNSRKWQPQVLAISGVTDCYQPIERKLQLTRQCLQVLAEMRNPVAMITKNHLITRDLDLLAELAKYNCIHVNISVTSLNASLTQILEPRTSVPARRLAAIEKLASAGVPVGILVAPIIPGLNDHEVPQILQGCRNAGASFANNVMLRLPHGLKGLFEDWLQRHYPDRKDKVLNRLREMHGGKLYQSGWHSRQSGHGVWADQIQTMFDLAKRKAGYDNIRYPALSTEHFRRVDPHQPTLFP